MSKASKKHKKPDGGDKVIAGAVIAVVGQLLNTLLDYFLNHR